MTQYEIASKNWRDIFNLKGCMIHKTLHFKQFLTFLYEYLNVLHKKTNEP